MASSIVAALGGYSSHRELVLEQWDKSTKPCRPRTFDGPILWIPDIMKLGGNDSNVQKPMLTLSVLSLGTITDTPSVNKGTMITLFVLLPGEYAQGLSADPPTRKSSIWTWPERFFELHSSKDEGISTCRRLCMRPFDMHASESLHLSASPCRTLTVYTLA
ncbi:hypothetical protein B0O80DRAFT_425336 [Mortierella sp. GBAus27b]|nr:hypothetical protein B0O80DRAFT_425336 [Mortierella sp. GBAus27b]